MHETFCSQNEPAPFIVAVFTMEKEAFRRTRRESLAHFGAPGMPALLRAPHHHIQHFCARELGTRSETYRGSAFTGVSEALRLVR